MKIDAKSRHGITLQKAYLAAKISSLNSAEALAYDAYERIHVDKLSAERELCDLLRRKGKK